MRECWANVYGPFATVGVVAHRSRAEADEVARYDRIGCVHVRLKPDGAPKRYASDDERFCWSNWPNAMRQGVPVDLMLQLHEGGTV